MEVYIGTILMFAGTFAPMGWAICDGRLLAIAQNQALFAILGTTYGGDGRTTFALPDLRGRVPVGVGQGPGLSPYTQGEQYGTEAVTLIQNQIPTHAHTFSVPCSTSGPDTGSPQNAVCANLDPNANYASAATPGATMQGGMSGATGGSLPHDNRQPSLCINYIIALQGIFPPRG
jgi:microcystin-dependent protein